jgi:hypothetical protein
MEIFEKLQKYKEGNLSYRDSVTLFFTIYPEKESALRDFLSSEDTFSRKKIKEGLQAKFDELVAIQEANNFKSFETKVRSINVSLLPEDLRKEHAKLSPLIREVSMNHARLDMCSTDEQRFELAKNIVTKWRIRQGIFDQIDRFNATGQVPVQVELLISGAQKPVKPLITVERDYKLEDDIRKLRVQRSKLKNKPHRFADYEKVCADIKSLEALRYA